VKVLRRVSAPVCDDGLSLLEIVLEGPLISERIDFANDAREPVDVLVNVFFDCAVWLYDLRDCKLVIAIFCLRVFGTDMSDEFFV